jgi:uncharacterized protein (TIGR02118 family)
MIKLVYCVRRKPGLSVEVFQRYWLESHGALVRSLRDVLPLERYVQSHTLPGSDTAEKPPGTPRGEPYDGIAEIWLDSEAIAGGGAISEEALEAQRRVMEDELEFVDHARSCVFYTIEHEIF